jgi:hypothetical protein
LIICTHRPHLVLHVAVGMPVTRHPPHGSGLEELPHPALTSSNNALNRSSGTGLFRHSLVIHRSFTALSRTPYKPRRRK